jgi:hypothetical protein
MINYGKTQSIVKPEPIKIDTFSVWVNTNIIAIEETVGEDMFSGYEYDMVQYTKDEYIKLLDTQLTDAQLALAEIYELIGG